MDKGHTVASTLESCTRHPAPSWVQARVRVRRSPMYTLCMPCAAVPAQARGRCGLWRQSITPLLAGLLLPANKVPPEHPADGVGEARVQKRRGARGTCFGAGTMAPPAPRFSCASLASLSRFSCARASRLLSKGSPGPSGGEEAPATHDRALPKYGNWSHSTRPEEADLSNARPRAYARH